MADEPTFHLDLSEQDSELPEVHPDECPDCKVPAEMGYGLAGGGIGAYSYCPQCGKLLAKTQDPENEEL
jgi:hypothetical protein